MTDLDSSPFTHLFNSNGIATDAEFLQIQHFLKAPTARLHHLSTQLQALDTQSTQIQSEQSSLLATISKHRVLISQVRKLPVEVLQEIFIACLPTFHNAVMSHRQPPMVLTQICSSWRNIAHATPQLWKSIHIAVPCNPTPGMFVESPNFQATAQQVAHRRSKGLLEWIHRSGSCPLHISFSQQENTPSDSSTDSIILHLIQFSERWRDVTFSAPYQTLRLVAAIPSSKLPLLESLFLNGRTYYSSISTPPHLDHRGLWTNSGIMQAPNLRQISLTELDEAVTQLPINWSRITKFSFQCTSLHTSGLFTVSRAYKILSACRDLITCKLQIGFRPEPQPPFFNTTITPIISLPYLTELSVREGASLATLFSLLHLPSLATLEFQTAIWPSRNTSTTLVILLTHSQCPIQHLTTDAQFFKREDFITCLRLCPQLVSLSIRQPLEPGVPPWQQEDVLPPCKIDDAILEMFTSPSSEEGGCLCPDLQVFNISSSNTFSETSLLRFLKAKNGDPTNNTPPIPGLAKLKTVSIAFQRPQILDITPQLEQYRQTGLQITISYPTMYSNLFSPFDGLSTVIHGDGCTWHPAPF